MKIQPFLFLTCAMGILIGGIESGGLYAQDISFTNLPSVQSLDYRVDPYIRAASQLQNMGKQAAVEQLLKLAKSAATADLSAMDYEQRTAILCRMLFTNKPGSDFGRPAFLGGPQFLDGEGWREELQSDITKNDVYWQSEPIEIVDGIPFAVVTGYGYEGIRDPYAAESYIRYCTTNCVWSSYHFSVKSEAEKQQAFKKLIASRKWQRPLEVWAQQYLMKQTQ